LKTSNLNFQLGIVVVATQVAAAKISVLARQRAAAGDDDAIIALLQRNAANLYCLARSLSCDAEGRSNGVDHRAG